jgi:SAM-dependent methyltransferase
MSVVGGVGKTGAVTRPRDYEEWHRDYDDPSSSLSWRLRAVQAVIEDTLDERPGEVSVLSLCAGEGRDVLEVLSRRDDAHRVAVTLVEIHPRIADRARRLAARTDAKVDVRVADAGCTDTVGDVVPADLVLLIGILGNISRADLDATISATPGLCRHGTKLLWSRAREPSDLNAEVRRRFAVAGFAELDYLTLERGSRPAVGVVRYDGSPQPLAAGRRLFTFPG